MGQLNKMDIDNQVQEGGIANYYQSQLLELNSIKNDKEQNARRLEAQRNSLNSQVRLLREELQLLQEQGIYVGEVIKPMTKNKVLITMNQRGRFNFRFSSKFILKENLSLISIQKSRSK